MKPQTKKYHGNFRRYLFNTRKFLYVSVRDKAAYFWVIGYPLLFIVIWGVAFNGTDTRSSYAIAIINEDPFTDSNDPYAIDGIANVSDYLEDLFDPLTGNTNLTESFILHNTTSTGDLFTRESALEALSNSELDAVIIIPSNFSEIILGRTNWYVNLVYLDNETKSALANETGLDLDFLLAADLPTDQQASYEIFCLPDAIGQTVIESVFNGILNEIMLQFNGLESIEAQSSTVENIEFTIFDVYSPGFVVVGVLVAIMMVGMKFGQEREIGLLERLDTTPVPRYVHMLAGATAQMMYSAVQIVIILGMLLLFGIQASPDVSWGLAFLNAWTVAFSCIGLGLIVASIAKTSDDAGGIAWLFILPLQFLSGGFFPLPNDSIGKFIPTTYSITAMKRIILLGATFSDVWQDLAINVGFGIVTMLIGVIIFTKRSKV